MFRSIEIESAIANKKLQTNQNMVFLGNDAPLAYAANYISNPIMSVQTTQPRDLTISSGHEMDIHTDKYDIHIDALGGVTVESSKGGVYDV